MYSAYRLSSLSIESDLVHCDCIEGDVDDKLQTFLFMATALYHCIGIHIQTIRDLMAVMKGYKYSILSEPWKILILKDALRLSFRYSAEDWCPAWILPIPILCV